MFTTNNEYTVLDEIKYFETVKNARKRVNEMLSNMVHLRKQSLNDQVKFVVSELLNSPYFASGALGEGDWIATSKTYEPGEIHLKQDPVYRFDGFDCQTFIQVLMGLLYSDNLSSFEEQIINISYGAATAGDDQVHYYNRNNFVEGDWNRINQMHGFLKDAMVSEPLAKFVKKTFITLRRQNWFKHHLSNLNTHIRVLQDQYGSVMRKRYVDQYTKLDFPNFEQEKIKMSYIPKEKIAIKSQDAYIPNDELLAALPTPAIIEIVRDKNLWTIGGKKITELFNTELCVSHMGVLYRQYFKEGEIVFYKTVFKNEGNHKVCEMKPIYAATDGERLMFAHATNARPKGYLWYFNDNGEIVCGTMGPIDNRTFYPCNRVEAIPLYDYLTDFQYGKHWYMESPSLLGIHIEELLPFSN